VFFTACWTRIKAARIARVREKLGTEAGPGGAHHPHGPRRAEIYVHGYGVATKK